MDLWILSQDKTKLKKTNYLQVEFDSWQNKSAIICNTDVVAVYETKERAMEVLDEIQKLVDQNVMFFVNSPCSLDLKDALKVKDFADTYGVIPSDRAMGEIKYISPNSVVFEMPKDKSE